MRRLTVVFAAFCLLLLFGQCNTTQSLSNQNTAWKYDDNDGYMRPKYAVYNLAPNQSRLYFQLNSSELLYTRNDNKSDFTAEVFITYTLRSEKNEKLVADSGHITLHDVNNERISKEVGGTIDLRAPDGERYTLAITLRDLHKKTAVYEELLVNKKAGAAAFYMLTAPGSAWPLYSNTVTPSTPLELHYNGPATTLWVRCRFKAAPPAPLPFGFTMPAVPAKPADSVYAIRPATDSLLRFPKRGMYFIQTDTASREGQLINCFNSGYPEITEADALAAPLRYLTTGEEYSKIMQAKDRKAAVDEFWLERCGSEERAREVLRQYYKRVESTNRYFTAHSEGWKSDRGMLFIIFGPPLNVYRSGDTETWIYGDNSSPMAVNFVFERVRNNPYSDNDFILNRNINYRNIWMHAVDEWRNGRAYYER